MMIRDRDLWRVLQCPHWPYWEEFGDRSKRRPLTDEKEQMLMGTLAHEMKIVRAKAPDMTTVKSKDPIRAAKRTRALMKAGVRVIYRPVLRTDSEESRPTLLERVEGKSCYGDWQYIAIRLKRTHFLRKEDLLIGAFDALVLESLQGTRPARSWQWSGDHDCFEILIEPVAEECRELIATVRRGMEGERPPPMFRKSCLDTSPWGTLCTALAESTNDIALIFNVDRRRLEALRAAGVQTVTEAATRDPATLLGTSPLFTARSLDLIQKQARTLEEGSTIIRAPFVDPTRGLEIHFDIESYPPVDFDYLFGFLLVDPDTQMGTSKQFVARRPSGERGMWKKFVRWLETLPTHYTIYHYSPYEPERVALLARRYGDQSHPLVLQFLDSCVDLKDSVRDHVIFPLRIYSLKRICNLLGFSWKGDVHDGAESVDVYERWLKQKQEIDLENICRYNEEDTRATQVLLAWLRSYATEETIYPSGTPWTRLSSLLSP
jgi:predicted RecB family nuclease